MCYYFLACFRLFEQFLSQESVDMTWCWCDQCEWKGLWPC
jgi:hypothetical protein